MRKLSSLSAPLRALASTTRRFSITASEAREGMIGVANCCAARSAPELWLSFSSSLMPIRRAAAPLPADVARAVGILIFAAETERERSVGIDRLIDSREASSHGPACSYEMTMSTMRCAAPGKCRSHAELLAGLEVLERGVQANFIAPTLRRKPARSEVDGFLDRPICAGMARTGPGKDQVRGNHCPCAVRFHFDVRAIGEKSRLPEKPLACRRSRTNHAELFTLFLSMCAKASFILPSTTAGRMARFCSACPPAQRAARPMMVQVRLDHSACEGFHHSHQVHCAAAEPP